MAEEMKTQEQSQEEGQPRIPGDISIILTGIGTLLDNTLTPIGNMLAQALESANSVAQQVLEGISNSLGGNQNEK